MAAAAKMLSAGLSRACAAATKSEEVSSRLFCMPWSSSSSSSAGSARTTGGARNSNARSVKVASQLSSDSFSRISRPRGVDCKLPSSDVFLLQHHKFVSDTPLQASFYDVKQQQPAEMGAQAVMQEFVVDEAAVGKVECNGRGCRPLFDDDTALSTSSSSGGAVTDWRTGKNAADVLESRIVSYQNRSITRDRATRGPKPHFPLDFAEYLDEVWMETAAAEKYFSAALAADQHDPRLLSEYAQFCWRSLSDVDRAESLFTQALALAPQDPFTLASYAHFLWQTDQ